MSEVFLNSLSFTVLSKRVAESCSKRVVLQCFFMSFYSLLPPPHTPQSSDMLGKRGSQHASLSEYDTPGMSLKTTEALFGREMTLKAQHRARSCPEGFADGYKTSCCGSQVLFYLIPVELDVLKQTQTFSWNPFNTRAWTYWTIMCLHFCDLATTQTWLGLY